MTEPSDSDRSRHPGVAVTLGVVDFRFVLLLACFFASGFAALLYQTAWTREFGFLFGTSELAVEWLEENYQTSPFFLWVDFFDPHEPWDPPEYMVKKYDAEYDGVPMLHPNYGKASDYTPEELRNLRAH